MHAGSPPSLPVELWLQIFRLATLGSWTYSLLATEYHPFQAVDIYVESPQVYAIKRALVLVCKQWRLWTMRFLCEDLVIPRAGRSFDRMLLEGEDLNATMPPCASLVRRVQLPYSSTITLSAHPLAAVLTLKQCSSLQILVRTIDTFSTLAYDFPTTCPPLPSLKRIDWSHHNEAARTGGINSLHDVLERAPNIQYLSVGGTMWVGYVNAPNVTICLEHLTTIRFRRINAYFMLKLSRWKLPALTHAIFDHISEPETFSPFWDAFGPQLRTIELGASLKFFMRDFLTHIFGACTTGLQELNYYVHFTHAPSFPKPVARDAEESGSPRPMEALETVRLHAHLHSFFRVGSPEYWEHLGRHFEAYNRSEDFPALKRIVLHGNWRAVVGDEEFKQLAQPLYDRGCTIQVA